jgi:spore germination protein KB
VPRKPKRGTRRALPGIPQPGACRVRKEAAATKKSDEIRYTQVIVLAALIVFATGFLAVPKVMVSIAGNAGWISMFLGGVLGVGVAAACGALAVRFPDLGLVQMSESVFGLALGRLVGLTFAAYGTAILAIASRQFVLAISIAFLQVTPTGVVSGVFYALVVYAAYLGIEPIARVSMVFFAVAVVSLVALVGLALPVSVPGRLLPVLGQGPGPILLGAVSAGSYTGEVIIMLAVLKYLRSKKGVARALATGVGIGTTVMALSTAFGVMMLGTRGIARVTFPAVETARMVGVGEFLERGEIIFLVLWFTIAITKLAAVFYASVSSTADVLGLRDYRPLVLPYGVLTLTLSLIPENIVESFVTLDYFRRYAVYYSVALPLALLAGALWRGKGAAHEDGPSPGQS